MSVESLPWTLLLLLAQFAAGVAALVFYVQWRGIFEAAFIKTCSWLVVLGALMLVLTALMVDPTSSVETYRLDSELLEPVRFVAMAMLLFSVVFFYFIRRPDEQFLSVATGATTVGLGVISLVLLAWMVREPTWNVLGPLLMMFSGAMILGSSMVAMVWGHWYLVNPKLPEGPLNELTLITLGSVLFGGVVTIINAVIPVGTPITSQALLAVDLAVNPGFWLRVAIGLVFPAVLAFMAYKSSTERSMMSATGLLYIAVGSVLA
ncbi:MAG: hypothetical protein AB7P33_04095, partial [Dehalococcoidia bacterium]